MSVVVYNGKKMKPFCLMNFEEQKEEVEDINPTDTEVEPKPLTPIL